MADSLQHKRCLVTAGAQGIGLAISRELIDRGARVIVHYFSSKEPAKALQQEFPEQVCLVAGDLTNREVAMQMVQEAASCWDGLDILINNAGSLVQRARTEEVSPELWQTIIDVNLSSMMWVTQAARPFLARQGTSAIVNLSSLAGRKGGHPGSLVYSMTKGGVITMTRALATELGPEGIRVNAIAPGLILGTSFHNTHTTPESAAQTIAGIPLGRAGTPEDVARAVAFLAAEHNGFINGAILDINGGVY